MNCLFNSFLSGHGKSWNFKKIACLKKSWNLEKCVLVMEKSLNVIFAKVAFSWWLKKKLYRKRSATLASFVVKELEMEFVF